MFGVPHSYEISEFLGHSSVWHPSELRKTAMLEKTLKFWGMRCTKNGNAREFDYAGLRAIDHIISEFSSIAVFGVLQSYEITKLFEHCSVWHTSELRNTAVLEKVEILGHEVHQTLRCSKKI